MSTFGLSVLKSIAKNQTIEEFVLYNRDIENSDKRDLHEMLGKLTTDQRTRYTTGEYTNEYGDTFPCIRLSASGEYYITVLLLFAPSLLLFTPA